MHLPWARRAAKTAAPTFSSDVAAAIATRAAPKTNNIATIASAYASTPILHSAIKRIGEAVGATTWELYRPSGAAAADKKARGNRAKLRRATGSVRRGMLTRSIDAAELEEISEHELLDFLYRGCPLLDGRRVLEVTAMLLDLHGEVFWLLDLDKASKPYYAWPIPTTWVSKRPTESQRTYEIKLRGQTLAAEPERVLRFSAPNPIDPYAPGIGIAAALADELDTDEYASEFIKSYFYNSCLPDAIVSLNGMSEAAIKATKQAWANEHQGPSNKHRTLFTNLPIDVRQLDVTTSPDSTIALRKFERDTILQTLGVPPEIVGILDGGSNRSTIDGGVYVFAKYVVEPRQDRMLATIQEQLAPRFAPGLVLSFVSQVPTDLDREMQRLALGQKHLTRAEWRESMGYASNGKIDECYVGSFSDVERPIDGVTSPETAPEPAAKIAKSVRRAFDADAVLDALDGAPMADGIDKLFVGQIERWGSEALGDLGSAARLDITNPRVAQHLRALRELNLIDVTSVTRGKLGALLADGFAAGKSIDALAREIEELFGDMSRDRATTIARTEVIRSSNFGTLEAYKQSGLDLRKRWIATHDDRVRDEHLALEAETRDAPIALEASFEIAGDTADAPGDFSDPANSINCRCTIVSAQPESEASIGSVERDAEIWRAFDRKVADWERRARVIVRRAFADQRDAVITALKEQAR